jgi:putative heme iron utilization protein
MNHDHADAVLLYAKVYGNLPEAIAAEMVSIDPHGMELTTQTPSTTESIRITFDHELVSAQDAHHTLVDMLKQVRSIPQA